MRAKLSASYSHNKVRLLAGREFVKNEYRDVPEEREDEARRLAGWNILDIETDAQETEEREVEKPRRRHK
jgi:hypothetical protein